MSSNGHRVSLDAVQAAIERACAQFEVSSLLHAHLKASAGMSLMFTAAVVQTLCELSLQRIVCPSIATKTASVSNDVDISETVTKT